MLRINYKTNILGLLFFCLCTLAWGSEPSVLAEFFGPHGIKDKNAAYSGEMLETYAQVPALGETLPKNVRVKFRKLGESQDQAVYAVQLSDGKHVEDWYAYLIKDGNIWKLRAVRTLALRGVIDVALQELEDKPDRSDEDVWAYQNMLLSLKSDGELKAYLKGQLADFNNIISLYLKGAMEQAQTAARLLFIQNIQDSQGVVELNIGGITDNRVGYLYVPEGKEPPAMDPNNYIYVEKIVDRWYIFKTT